jgi:hypothetical protein
MESCCKPLVGQRPGSATAGGAGRAGSGRRLRLGRCFLAGILVCVSLEMARGVLCFEVLIDSGGRRDQAVHLPEGWLWRFLYATSLGKFTDKHSKRGTNYANRN